METVNRIMSQHYTGFSVYADTRVNYSKYNKVLKDDLGQILRYIAKPAVSLDKIEMRENGKNILYKGRYHKGKKRNFEIFDPIDFIAAVTSHVPNRGQKYINYYGWYSNKSRGLRKKNEADDANTDSNGLVIEESTNNQRKFSKTWAMLIKKVWEIDPMECPKCKSRMKVTEILVNEYVVNKTLEEYGIKTDNAERAPPLELADEVDAILCEEGN
jgi:hypothetical protein